MRIKIRKIGRVRGLSAQCSMGEIVEFRATAKGLMLGHHRRPRDGWKQAFAASTEANHDLLSGATINTFDREEWQW